MSESKDDFSWIIAPLIGVASILGAYIFSNMNDKSQQQQQSQGLPPPPPNQKPSGCGCSKKI